jgi:hypothetical protein
MAATLTELREGLATRLGTIPGLQASAVVLTNPSLPTAYVFPGEINYHRTMTGHTDWNLVIELQVATVSDIGSQKKLDAYLDDEGASSIRQVVEADPTLGGVADDTTVMGVRDYGMFARAQGDAVLGARVLVWVLA